MRVTIANGEEETVNTAPWRRRSLLRRPRWARGAALMAKRGLRMLLTLRRHKEQRPFSRARRRGASVVAVRLAACVVVASRTVERGSCGCRRRAASSRGDDHDGCTASGPVQSTGADDQAEACGSFRHPGREVGADHALCTARRGCSGPGGPRAAAQDQAPDQGGSDKAQRERRGAEPSRRRSG